MSCSGNKKGQDPASTKIKRSHHDTNYELAMNALPADGGIVNARGYLFHHDCRYFPIPEFTEAEKQVLRGNWKNFADEMNVPYSYIFRFTKTYKDGEERIERKRSVVRENAMWPKLCRGLEDRPARSVRYVIVNVFGPKCVPNFTPTRYLSDPKLRSAFLHARQKFEDDRLSIAVHLNISFTQVGYIYLSILQMEKEIVGHVLVRMWRYIPQCLLHDKARAAFAAGAPLPTRSINWTRLAFLIKRMASTCQTSVEEVYPKVCALMKDGLSAEDAIAKVSGCTLPRLQPHDLCSFARIVCGELETGGNVGAVDMSASIGRMRQRVEDEMQRLGVYGFYTFARTLTPFSHCRLRLMRLIRNIRYHILPRLFLDYTLKDLLTVVVRTLEDYYMSGEAENEMEEEEQGGADGAARGAGKKINGIRVATGDLVAHLFLYTREEICEDFVPPWKFKQIVPARFSSVLAMFDETRKNEFYISSTDVNKKKKLIRESTAVQREREGEVEDLLKEEEDGESTDEEELVRVCSGEKKEKGGAKEKTSVQKTTPTGEEVIVFVKNKKLREEKDQMEQKKMEDVSVEERKKRKKEKKEKRRLEEQREQEETEMEQDAVEKKRRKKEKKDRKRLLQMEQEEEEREKKGHKKGKEEAEE